MHGRIHIPAVGVRGPVVRQVCQDTRSLRAPRESTLGCPCEAELEAKPVLTSIAGLSDVLGQDLSNLSGDKGQDS